MRKWIIGLVLVAVVIAFLPPGQAVSQQIREVFVTNFPKSQQVHGVLKIEGPLHSTRAFQREDIVVPPVERHETSVLISGGSIETDGFTHLTLSLQGEVRGKDFRDGDVGVVLIPDEAAVTRAFDEAGQLQFPLETSAPLVQGGSTYFSSQTTSREIGFPKYRIYFYNSSNRPVGVNLYGYLKN